MNVTNKEEATQLAELRKEEDANRMIRQVEAKISLWDGTEDIVLRIPTEDRLIGQWVSDQYGMAGWSSEVKEKLDYNRKKVYDLVLR